MACRCLRPSPATSRSEPAHEMTTPADQTGPAATGPAGTRDRRLRRAPRPPSPEGRMPLTEHIRELRTRIFKAALGLAAAMIIGWFVYPYVWHFIQDRKSTRLKSSHLGISYA